MSNKVIAEVNKPSRSKITYFNGLVIVVGAVVNVLHLWGYVDQLLVDRINQTLLLITPSVTFILRVWFTNGSIKADGEEHYDAYL